MSKTSVLGLGSGQDARSAGVYRISCQGSDAVYIGSTGRSAGIRSRIWDHVKTLRRGIHGSWKLQEAWDNPSLHPFRVEILEVMLSFGVEDKEYLLEREQWWIDFYAASECGWNVLSTAGSCLGVTRTPEQRERLSQAKSSNQPPFKAWDPDGNEHKAQGVRRFCREHGLTKACVLDVLNGRLYSHQDWRFAWVDGSTPDWVPASVGRDFIVVSPGSEVFLVRNLMAFCREHDLSYGSLLNKAQGKTRNKQGWQCAYADGSSPAYVEKVDPKMKQWIVRDPEGREYYVTGLRTFCREHDLNASHLGENAKGVCGGYKGWTCQYADGSSPEWRDKKLEATARRYMVRDPDGNEYDILSLNSFCSQRGLGHAAQVGLTRVAQGKRKSYKGWYCQYVDTKPQETQRPKAKTWILTSPAGQVSEITNLGQFAASLGLDPNWAAGCRKAAKRGSLYKGWACRIKGLEN